MSQLIVSEKQNILNPKSVTFEERLDELQKQDEMAKKTQERLKGSPYKSWIQMNNDPKVRKSYRALLRENPTAGILFDFMSEHMDGRNALVCSYQVFQDALDIGRTTTSKAVKTLVERGFIAVKRSGRSNVYLLNDNLVWKSWGKNKKYCEFPANIILSAAEQYDIETTDFKALKAVELHTKEEEHKISQIV